MARTGIVAPLSLPSMLVVAGWLGEGLTLVAGRIFQIDVNPALVSTVRNQQLTLGCLLVVGSGLMIAAGVRWPNVSTTWRLELLGLPLLLAAWILYTVSVAFPPEWHLSTPAAFPIVLGLSFTAAVGVRLRDVVRTIHRTRRNVEGLPREVRGNA